MTSPEEYTLDELSEQAGIPARVIRSYVEQGLLRGPSSKGRYARYSGYHLNRLLAIRALREQGQSLADIRIQLVSMSDQQIAEAGAATRPVASPSNSALEYLRQIEHRPDRRGSAARADANSVPPQQTAGPQLGKPPEMGSHFERLLLALQEQLASRRVDRQAHGEAWFRIEVTPDIELNVRGAFTPEALATLERLADYLREIALGGIGPPAPT